MRNRMIPLVPLPTVADNIAFRNETPFSGQFHFEYKECFPGASSASGANIIMIGFSTRLSFAFRCFFSLLFQGKFPQDVLLEAGAG